MFHASKFSDVLTRIQDAYLQLSRIAAPSLAIVLVLIYPAKAWDAIGHRIVARVAENHLSSSARSVVRSLLAMEGHISMAEIASWADNVVSLRIPRQPSHVIRLKPDYSEFDPGTQCPDESCVIGAIQSDIDTLSDLSATGEARLLALKYLVHFVGDVHQPFHASLGTRTVVYRGNAISLHIVWDKLVIPSDTATEDELVSQVEKYNVDPLSLDGPPIAWALEGRGLVRDVILPPVRAYKVGEEPPELPDTYMSENWPLARQRLALAGRRLAFLLNRAL